MKRSQKTPPRLGLGTTISPMLMALLWSWPLLILCWYLQLKEEDEAVSDWSSCGYRRHHCCYPAVGFHSQPRYVTHPIFTPQLLTVQVETLVVEIEMSDIFPKWAKRNVMAQERKSPGARRYAWYRRKRRQIPVQSWYADWREKT